MMLGMPLKMMISPPPLYCQFIKEDKQNSVDPPQKTGKGCDTNNNRKNVHRSSRNSNNNRRDRYKTQLQ